MLESEKFRRYAKDCIRIAATMNGKDRQTLLAIAEAWEARARRPTADSTRRTAEPVRRALNCQYDFVHRKTTDVVPR